ncbi:alpha/beta fold hydrolase [Oceanobacillus kapialis]|uniref:Alpha/beta fold hydrolase n=2 Tax=Oceanobacillus kapialis TaxID=481353 RepID=A0ABW5PYS3_9BACI
MRYKTSDGLNLYVEVSGKGLPCLFLHGRPGYWSKSFQHFADNLLNKNVQMIYLDQRGCGRSEHSPEQDYSLHRIMQDIEELRTQLGITEWLIMGHSFGGILAVNYAHQFATHVKGLILSNVTLNMFDSFQQQISKGTTILHKPPKKADTEKLELFMESYYEVLISLMEKGLYDTLQFVDVENKKAVDLVDREGLQSDPNFQQFIFSSQEYFQDFTLLTKEISKPVLVIAGEQDYAVGPKHHTSFNFHDQKVKVLRSAHHPYVEDQENFQQALSEFFFGVT